MPVGFLAQFISLGFWTQFLSEHKACSSPGRTHWGGGGEDAVMKPVCQCCLNIVDNSVKFLFMTISV